MAQTASLRGFVAQGMDGRKKPAPQLIRAFPPGSYTFVVPRTATYEVAGWSCGQNQIGGGYSVSGAFGLRRLRLFVGQKVTIAVGNGDALQGNGGASGSNTTTSVTFPDGSAMTWTDGNASTGAVASVAGADTAVAGNASNSAAVSAPSYGNYTGGAPSAGGAGRSPGGGAFTVTNIFGTSGLVLMSIVGPGLRAY